MDYDEAYHDDFSNRFGRIGALYAMPAAMRCPSTQRDPKEELDAARRRADAELRRAERLEKQLAAQPEEPADGSVIRFKHKFDNNPKYYTYVAVRAGDRWYLSGRTTTPRPLTWSQLVTFANVGKIRLATNFQKLHPRGKVD